MERAVVLIGVRRAGSLTELRAALEGVRAMKQWATAQGIDRRFVLTDEQDEVRVADVADAIAAVVDAGTVRQLIVYFAGHGVNRIYTEYWLLSRAPMWPGEAVNVAASAELARRCGIPHVVFISDACRTAPEGIGAQAITGTPVFPNNPGRPAGMVDQFFATRVGDAAHEIRDPLLATRRFRSAYTDVVVRSLNGRYVDLLEPDDDRPNTLVLRPWPLKRALPDMMLDELAALGVDLTVTQEPDAVVTSDPRTSWLSAVPRVSVTVGTEGTDHPPVTRSGGVQRSPSLADATADALVDAIAGGPLTLEAAAGRSGHGRRGELLTSMAASATRRQESFGPPHYETGSGLKVRGARVVDVTSSGARIDGWWDEGVRTHLDGRGGATVALRFGSGRSAVVPVIDQFIGSLEFENDLLMGVAYEPMDYSSQWHDIEGRIAEIRRVRALAATATQHGTFRLQGTAGQELAMYLQQLKGLDPALAVYAAYAYHDLGMADRIREMYDYQRSGLGVGLFDVALLARAILDGDVRDRLLPPLPMLSRGWSLLEVFGASLPDEVARLGDHLTPSLWTLFDADAAPLVTRAMASGDLG